jgi:hypothetical protein
MSPGFNSPLSFRGALALALLLPLMALAPPARAQAQVYTVDIRPVLNDLDIKIDHVADSRMLVVNLTNNSPTRVRCEVRFDASPQSPRRSTRSINPGQKASSVLRAQRRWFAVAVDVVCEPSVS